nr:MAG TPA: hypothetical protein [Caudoviricetes sp.]
MRAANMQIAGVTGSPGSRHIWYLLRSKLASISRCAFYSHLLLFRIIKEQTNNFC